MSLSFYDAWDLADGTAAESSVPREDAEPTKPAPKAKKKKLPPPPKPKPTCELNVQENSSDTDQTLRLQKVK